MKNTMVAVMSAMICFAMEAAAGDVGEDYPYVYTPVLVPGSYLVQQMAFTLVPLTLAFILLLTCCCLCRMDPDKSQDTMLYAKFIANTDAK